MPRETSGEVDTFGPFVTIPALNGRHEMSNIVDEIGKKGLGPSPGDFRVGDTVEVHCRIVEGDKERIQVFAGTVIARRGGAENASFTVRRLVQGQGVERVFPLRSPRVEKVVVMKTGRVRRAKLHYLRGRTGKATRLAERRDARGAARAEAKAGDAEAAAGDAEAAAEPAPEPESAPEE
jgi:large subunit ribosomal protein L19